MNVYKKNHQEKKIETDVMSTFKTPESTQN